MVHDFILVYALDSGVGAQEDVLRQVAGSDCADVSVGWGRPGSRYAVPPGAAPIKPHKSMLAFNDAHRFIAMKAGNTSIRRPPVE